MNARYSARITMKSNRLPTASLLPRDTLIDRAKGCPVNTMSEGFRRLRRQGQRSRPYAGLHSIPIAQRSSTASLRQCGKSIPDGLGCSSFSARIGPRRQTASPNFSGFRYVRGQKQLVTRAAPERPHAPDQAHHPYVESSPSLAAHSLAATFWTNALAGNWRQCHLNPSEGSIRSHPDGTVLGL